VWTLKLAAAGAGCALLPATAAAAACVVAVVRPASGVPAAAELAAALYMGQIIKLFAVQHRVNEPVGAGQDVAWLPTTLAHLLRLLLPGQTTVWLLLNPHVDSSVFGMVQVLLVGSLSGTGSTHRNWHKHL
jgi:hypothetical protein